MVFYPFSVDNLGSLLEASNKIPLIIFFEKVCHICNNFSKMLLEINGIFRTYFKRIIRGILIEASNKYLRYNLTKMEKTMSKTDHK